jgi:hypothetical protein
VLPVGTAVYAGQTITAVGENVAPSSGDHLHFEVITGATPISANGGSSIGLSGTQGRVDPASFTFDGDGGGLPPIGTWETLVVPASPFPAPSKLGGPIELSEIVDVSAQAATTSLGPDGNPVSGVQDGDTILFTNGWHATVIAPVVWGTQLWGTVEVFDAQNRAAYVFEQSAGGYSTETFDPTNTQPWDTHTVETNAAGQVLADTYDYSTTIASYLNGSHTLADFKIDKLDAASVEQLLAQMEREAFDGGAIGDHVPMPEVYNHDVFNSGYALFDQSTYNIQFGISDSGDTISLNTTIKIDNPFGLDGFDFSWLDDLVTLGGGDDWFSWDFFSADINWWDPILLDLDGDGVEIAPRQDSTAYFNLDTDGFKEQTAWMGRGDGMLVIDRPAAGGTGAGDGNITRLDEISFSTAPGQSDLQGLKANYDSNNDNLFNAADAISSSGFQGPRPLAGARGRRPRSSLRASRPPRPYRATTRGAATRALRPGARPLDPLGEWAAACGRKIPGPRVAITPQSRANSASAAV